MSCALVFLDRDNLFIGSDTALSVKTKDGYRRVNGFFKKSYIFNNHIYFVSGEYDSAMYFNHLITHYYPKDFILGKLKDLKPKIEILDCYFDIFPTVDRYAYQNDFEEEKIVSPNGVYMFSVGYKTQECYDYALTLFKAGNSIQDIYKKTFSHLVCDCIGETLDIFTLDKSGPKFVDTYGLTDTRIKRVACSTGYQMLIADTIVGNLIAGNNLVISNSTDEGEATFYVDADGARLTNADLVLNNTTQNSSLIMNSTDGIRLVHDGMTVFEATMNGQVTVQGYAQDGDYVTEDMLATSGATTINGGNITTGVIRSSSGNTTYNLNEGYIISGVSNQARYEVYPTYIRWYTVNNNTSYLTGVIHSIFGKTFLGANSEEVRLGWCPNTLIGSTDFSICRGIEVSQGGNDRNSAVRTNTYSVDIMGVNGLNVSYGVSARSMSAWETKPRVVKTSYGIVSINALESPKPSFCDYGYGEIEEDGSQYIMIDPRLLETIYADEKHCYFFQTQDGSQVTYEEINNGCIVYGKPGTKFNWIMIASQFDSNCNYAEITNDVPYPVEPNPAENLVEDVTYTGMEYADSTVDSLLSDLV